MCRTSFHGDDMHVLMGIQWAPESSTGGEGGGIQRGDAEGGGIHTTSHYQNDHIKQLIKSAM